MQEVRFGVAGLTHGHVWGLLDAWAKTPDVRLVAIADETPLMEKVSQEFEHRYADWREMLDKHEFDVLLVTSDNVESSEIAVEALKRGIHCMVEKAMAANAKDADRMLAAAKEGNAKLMINWPLAWAAWLPEFKKQIDQGALGHVFHLRYRNGHFGPKEIGCDQWFVGWLYDEAKNGGGAIADFGSYGAVFARYLFGMPESVYCIRHNTTKEYEVSDDHAVILLKYPKREVFLEGTWATRAWDTGPNPVAYGKDGTLGVYKSGLTLHGAQDSQDLEVPELAVKSPAEYFLNCIREGREPEGITNPEIAADACRILDAALKSSASGCAEKP